jgi:hypothetical protein
VKSDFMSIDEIAAATTFSPKSLYNQHSSGSGAFACLLTKIGGRVGCWRSDYELWIAAQRRITAETVLAPSRARGRVVGTR